VLDERAVTAHADDVVRVDGRIDVALSAAAFPYTGGTPFPGLAVDEVMRPIDALVRSTLVVAGAAAPHMRGSGAILTLSTAGARFARPGNLGFGTACAAVEHLTGRLAAELGPHGIRAVCLRAHAVPDAAANGSYTGEVFAPLAAASGITVAELLERWGQDGTLLGRLPTLAQVAGTAVFLASDHAAAITGTVVDLTCGNALRAQGFGGALVGVLD
jgi:NAD(P)-dependent dehydrogenase (short-subunit alcohol dehydrogenase family)